MSRKEKNRGIYVISFSLVCIILLSAFAFSEIYPFGNRSLLIWDLRWQYIQFFEWFRQVLLESGNLFYTFNTGLGSNMIGLYAYYLSSPLNLLVIFFEDIQLFVFVITILKLGIAAGTCAAFLKRRFECLKDVWVILLSVCYGTMSYSLAQKSNLMWLDGLIFLPLISLGVYNIIARKKKGLLYSSVLLSVISNWYIAYMCCLFSIFYFFYELVISDQKKTIKDSIKTLFSCGFTMALAVLSSMILFFPTIVNLLQGKGIESGTSYRPEFRCDFVTIIRGMFPGVWRAKLFGSESTAILLFCGSFTVICIVGYFCTKKIGCYKKIISAIFFGGVIFSLVFIPLENIWNGFRNAGSYYCRASFLLSFFMLFLAANYLEVTKHYLLSIKSVQWIIMVVTIIELSFNAYSIVRAHAPFVAGEYELYDKEQKEQIEVINSSDKEFFRMEQASLYGERFKDYLGVFNEGLSYSYRSFATYSSTFNAKVMELYKKCGYHDYLKYMQYNEPLLVSDSLLGIKYIISDHEILGCTLNDELSIQDTKKVYENPYALDLGFLINDGEIENISTEDIFQYQNEMLSELIGEDIKCYKKVDARKVITDDTVQYILDIPQEDHIMYGYIKYVRNNKNDADLYVNGELRTKYSRVTSYKVFQIDTKDNVAEAMIAGTITNEDELEGVFYYLDIEEFERVIKKLQEVPFKLEIIKDGYIKGTVNAKNHKKLLLTIPYDLGWEITCNGKQVQADPNRTFIVLDILEEENVIEMKYSAPGLKEGVVITLISIFIFGMWCLVDMRSKRLG